LLFAGRNFHRLGGTTVARPFFPPPRRSQRGIVLSRPVPMAQPEAYIGGADKLFDANGKLINEGTRKFLQGFMQAYDSWITANSKA
jgi:hypothetical protein